MKYLCCFILRSSNLSKVMKKCSHLSSNVENVRNMRTNQKQLCTFPLCVRMPWFLSESGCTPSVSMVFVLRGVTRWCLWTNNVLETISESSLTRHPEISFSTRSELEQNCLRSFNLSTNLYNCITETAWTNYSLLAVCFMILKILSKFWKFA